MTSWGGHLSMIFFWGWGVWNKRIWSSQVCSALFWMPPLYSEHGFLVVASTSDRQIARLCNSVPLDPLEVQRFWLEVRSHSSRLFRCIINILPHVWGWILCKQAKKSKFWRISAINLTVLEHPKLLQPTLAMAWFNTLLMPSKQPLGWLKSHTSSHCTIVDKNKQILSQILMACLTTTEPIAVVHMR